MGFAALHLVFFGGSVSLAGLGGEAFLKSILGSAHHPQSPKAIVATTLAAFATSSPELMVSTSPRCPAARRSAWATLGSKGVNVALIFGIALRFGAITTARGDFGRDFMLALLGVVGLQVVAVHWAPAQAMFSTVDLTAFEWLLAAAVASSVLLIDETRKLVVRPKEDRRMLCSPQSPLRSV
jgi:Ca2+/Na+ antiporter